MPGLTINLKNLFSKEISIGDELAENFDKIEINLDSFVEQKRRELKLKDILD